MPSRWVKQGGVLVRDVYLVCSLCYVAANQSDRIVVVVVYIWYDEWWP